MRHLCFIVFMCWSICVLPLRCAMTAEELDERLFELGSRSHGNTYILARDALVKLGRNVLPWLETKAQSTRVRERLLAQIIRLRVENPNEVNAMRKALLLPLNNSDVWKEVKAYDSLKPDRLPQKSLGVAPRIACEALFETDSNGDSEAFTAGTALEFYLAPSADVAEAFLAAPRKYRQHRLYLAGIIKLGVAVIPFLRQALSDFDAFPIPPAPADPQSLTSVEFEARARYWDEEYRVQTSVEMLCILADKDSAPQVARVFRKIKHCRKSGSSVPALSSFVAAFKVDEALPELLEWTLIAASKERRWDNHQNWEVMRKHLVSFGPAALPVIEARLKAKPDERERAALVDMRAEVTHAPEKEREITALRLSISFDSTPEMYLQLRRLTGEDVFEKIVAFAKQELEYPVVVNYEQRERMVYRGLNALAILKDTRTVAVVADIFKLYHDLIERDRNQGEKRPDAFDPQAARENAERFEFGGKQMKWARYLLAGDEALRVLRSAGTPEAEHALKAAAVYPEFQIQADAWRLALAGDRKTLSGQLNAKEAAVREIAARVLAEESDADDGATVRELLRAAARRCGDAHKEWLARALRFEKELPGAITELGKSTDIRERILGELLQLERAEPVTAKRYQNLLTAAASHVSMMHVWGIGNVEMAGRALVKKIAAESPKKAVAGENQDEIKNWNGELNERHTALLEGTCLFGQGILRRGVASFALAELHQDRSKQALAASFDIGSLGGSNPAALALVSFGKDGAELAAKAPAPVPGEFDTGLRMTAHRAGVRVLAENKDIRGVDEILKGLDTMIKEPALDGRDQRAHMYLTAAGKFSDARLIEPLLSLLSEKRRDDDSVAAEILTLLSAYDDPRVITILLERTALNNFDKDVEGNFHSHNHCVAVKGLTRRLGKLTLSFLADRLKDKNTSGELKAGILMALAELSYAERPAFPGNSTWFSTGTQETKVLANEVRNAAFPILVAALNDQSSRVNRIAAVALTIFAAGNDVGEYRREYSTPADTRAVKPLNDWCRTQRSCFYWLADFFSKHGDKESGEVALRILRAGPPESFLLAPIRVHRPTGALPVLKRDTIEYIRRHGHHYGGPRELEVIAVFGDDGGAALLDLMGENDVLLQADCAQLLAKLNYAVAAGKVRDTYDAVLSGGSSNPNLKEFSDDREQAFLRAFTEILESLAILDPAAAKTRARAVLLHGSGKLHPAALKVLVGL